MHRGAREEDEAPFSIRRAHTKDTGGILECLRVAFDPYRASYSAQAFEDTVMSAQSIQKRLAEMSVFVTVSRSGRIVGTIGYNMIDREEGHIRGMVVLPDHAGTGVAQRLLETVEKEVRQHGGTRISLDTTEPLRRAARFYERNGFRLSGVVRDYFGMRLFEYEKTLG
jgi:N-acetylglutamate synthase-like GNAT family acetyltransferase